MIAGEPHMSIEDTLLRAREILSKVKHGLENNNEREVCENAFRLATLVLQEGPRLALTLGRDVDIESDLLSQAILLRVEQLRETGASISECAEIADMSWRLLERLVSGLSEREP